MRIALVHSYYSRAQPSGENNIVDLEADLLRERGHAVLLISRETDKEAHSPAYPFRAAMRVSTGRGDNPLTEINSFHPDVVHIHNLIPNFGHRWVRKLEHPLVLTLHNFLLLCAAGSFTRAGEPCTECLRGRTPSLRHSCYRHSRLGSFVLWARNPRSLLHDPVVPSATIIVVLSQRSADIFHAVGLPQDRVRIVSNPSRDNSSYHSRRPQERPPRWLFAGRLSSEKGIADLVSNWPSSLALDVMGGGPLLSSLSSARTAGVQFLGSVPHEELLNALPEYDGLIFPSKCFENSPLIYAESLAAGTPVIALAGNAVADAVATDRAGIVIDSLTQSNLINATLDILSRGSALRSHCHQVFNERYSTDSWVNKLEGIFTEAIDFGRPGKTIHSRATQRLR